MKNFIKNLILSIAILTMWGGFAPSALAVAPMTAVFEHNPLFGEVNFLPGDSKDGDVTVTNNTDTSQSVYAESVNGFDPDGLGTQLRLRVLEGAIVRYDDVFSDFLSVGPVSLSALPPSASTVYTFEVSFINSTDNDYQGKSLGFDLCIGFSGGTLQCGGTVTSEENPFVETPGGSGGGGGGGGGGSHILIIFNEHVSNITVVQGDPGSGVATIEWDTNLLATSQVIYGPASGGPYTLSLGDLPNFGYPFGTAEDPIKVIHHTMFLTGLSPGVTYVYRVVSHASPPTVSVEHQFALALASPGPSVSGSDAGGISGTGSNTFTARAGGIVAGTSSEETASGTPTLQLASALSGLPNGFFEFFQSYDCWFTLLLMLLALIVAWIFTSRWFGYEDMMSPYEFRRRRILFFIGGILLMFAYALIFRKECIIVPLLVILAVLIAWFAWHRLGKT
jgi:hypothetical protein